MDTRYNIIKYLQYEFWDPTSESMFLLVTIHGHLFNMFKMKLH